MTCSTFVASCSAVGRLLSPQQATRFGAPRPPRPWQHHNHPSYGVDSPQAKEVPSIALEKRRKQYFFKLLSAARNRDTRLLVSVLKSLDKETEYVRMQSNATHADPLRIQDVLLKAASRCGQTALADDFFTTMRARGQFPTQHTAGAYLDALKLDGQADRCVAVYNEMVDGDVDLGCVCFNIVVSALVQDGNFAGGMDMLQCASARWGVTPDAYTFNIFFGAAAKQNTGASKAAAKEARALMAHLGVAPDRITVNAQISRAVKEGRLDEAIETFGRLLDGGFSDVVPDVISFNVGIAAFMANNMDNKAFKLLDEMERRGIRPRADTFNSILTGMTKVGDTLGVIEVFNKYLRQDEAGDENGVVPSLVSYNLVLQALCLQNDKGQARLVIAEMRKRNVKPDNITLTALVRLQCSREDVYHVIETARKLRIRPSLAFLNSCIRALGEHNDVYGACQVMDRIKSLDNLKPDAISYNSLIYALVQEPWVSEVIQKTDLANGSRKPAMVSPITTASMPNDAEPLTASSRQKKLPSSLEGTSRFQEVIGAEAALLLLEEMKVSAADSGAVPDIFTYTTVISGMARAEDARRFGRDVKEWWRMPGSPTCSEGGDSVNGGPGLISSAEMCKQLYMEAVGRGIRINGKLCNAVMVGFGSDLTGAVAFWRQHIRSALGPASSGTTDKTTDDAASIKSLRVEKKRKADLFSAYCGLLHVCGRAQRPDAAMKVVYALRKDKITPSSTLSNSYFKAKKVGKQLEDGTLSGRAPFRVMQLLHGQMEDALEGTCGISKHSDPLNLPIERIIIRF